jgi:hypothetical protein
MPAPDTWSAYYRRAAADEAALGNDKAARTHLRYARIAAVREALLPVVGTQDADRHLAASLTAGGTFFPDLICNPTHNGGVNL